MAPPRRGPGPPVAINGFRGWTILDASCAQPEDPDVLNSLFTLNTHTAAEGARPRRGGRLLGALAVVGEQSQHQESGETPQPRPAEPRHRPQAKSAPEEWPTDPREAAALAVPRASPAAAASRRACTEARAWPRAAHRRKAPDKV